jgi:aldehyde:ferredoxin oxidoreductase
VFQRVDSFAVERKGELAKLVQDEVAMYEAVGFCQFAFSNGVVPPELLTRMLYAATGVEEFKSLGHLRLVGERVFNLEKAFNVREGIGREHDTMPERILRELVPRPPAKGQAFELEKLLEDYYKARGWDPKTGRPTCRKLEELGCFVVDVYGLGL